MTAPTPHPLLQADPCESRLQDLHAKQGCIVLATEIPQRLGGVMNPREFQQAFLAEYRWLVVGKATKADLLRQRRVTGQPEVLPWDSKMSFFYFVVAMD